VITISGRGILELLARCIRAHRPGEQQSPFQEMKAGLRLKHPEMTDEVFETWLALKL
jgi:hypothetical protein